MGGFAHPSQLHPRGRVCPTLFPQLPTARSPASRRVPGAGREAALGRQVIKLAGLLCT